VGKKALPIQDLFFRPFGALFFYKSIFRGFTPPAINLPAVRA
jgi:hypothetical protein